MSAADDFVLVTHRRRHRKLNIPHLCTGATNLDKSTQDCEVDHELLLRKINDARVEVNGTSYARYMLHRLIDSLADLDTDGVSEIVCYGLGRFSQERASRYQLGLLLCLRTWLRTRVHVYDPVFCPAEVRALRALNIEIIETNEQGKRVVRPSETTLVYMPHCPQELSNNFLYANWGNGLSDCILLANSFSKIVNTSLHRDLLNTAGYILRIRPYVTEIKLVNTFVHEGAFNDLSIHFFAKQDLLKAPADFWNSREEPQYSVNHIELVTAADK